MSGRSWLVRKKRSRLLKYIAIALTIAGIVSITSLSLGKVSPTRQGWRSAKQSIPPALISQIQSEHSSFHTAVDVGRMKAWKVSAARQTNPLYLIDSRVADSAKQYQANPFCGASGCEFWGYIPGQNQEYQKVISLYLNPNLPQDKPLFAITDSLQHGLPVLRIQQFTHGHHQALTLAFNGDRYETVEVQTLSHSYE
jgi:hypothetical protein